MADREPPGRALNPHLGGLPESGSAEQQSAQA